MSVLATWILAAAGSGSSSYGGGGGGGGGGGSSGSGSSDGGDLLFFVIGALIWGLVTLVGVMRYQRKRRRRVRVVQLAAAEAAADDAAFEAGLVVVEAERLFREVQAAWSKNDVDTLDTMVGADLMVEWRRRLNNFAKKGWHNVVTITDGPTIEYVGLVNRADDADDRVVVRIEATMDDYVEKKSGKRVMKDGEVDESTDLCEYWTLTKRDGRWTLLSIEQREEGDHQLEGKIVASPWGDTERLHAEAVAERAVAEAAPADVSPAELADLDFEGEARVAALDLALADGRFDPDLVEASVRRAVEAWTEAVDGDDGALAAVARPEVVAALLHPGGEGTRLVVRGPEVRHIRIARLDAAATPPAIEVELEVHGRRYVEDRDTAEVVDGAQCAATTFTERWTLALDGPPEWPWQLATATPMQPAQ